MSVIIIIVLWWSLLLLCDCYDCYCCYYGSYCHCYSYFGGQYILCRGAWKIIIITTRLQAHARNRLLALALARARMHCDVTRLAHLVHYCDVAMCMNLPGIREDLTLGTRTCFSLCQ